MKETIGEDAGARFAPAAMQSMRSAIAETGGREVFFAGALNGKGVVERVRVCARGTGGAVPAVFEDLDPRDVVIHNHPGGNLAPSGADLELAIVYSHNGHGVYIVDNDVSRVYVVVEPLRDKDVTRLSSAELAKFFRPNGPVARAMPDFEVRPQQAEMLDAVAEAFNSNGILVIEAPTGVGKTMAYLMPAVLWAVRNRERVVVSTKTINLQEQIVFKDIPLLQKCMDVKFSAVLVKGRQNYVCPRRLERALSEATLFSDDDEAATLKAIAEWAKKTEDGSTADLPFVPPREIWEKVCSEADTCTAGQCQQAGNCFVTKARREIAKADIVVVNHHMLFSDLSIKREAGNFSSLAVLPAFERLILDEAHHVEDSATEYFGVEATRNGAMSLLGRFLRTERGRERGLVPFIKLKLVQEAVSLSHSEIDAMLKLIAEELLPAWGAARQALETAFMALRSLGSEKCKQIGRDIKWRLTQKALDDPELREVHAVYVMPAAEEVTRLAKHCTALHAAIKDIRPDAHQSAPPLAIEAVQLQAYGDRLLRLASALAEGTSPELEANTVRWIEIDGANERIVRVVRCPLDVGKPLSDWIYPNLKTVVMTSATLTVEKQFDFLRQRIGLDRVTDREMDSRRLDSPFDFETQAVLCIPGDLSAPDSASFHDDTADCVRRAVEITGGHAFILFTSFYALNVVHKALADEFAKKRITVLKQGDANRTHLLDRFRRDRSSVLFATDSFWEGVDVAGEALQCVIVPKLPFRVPTEPVLEARAEAIEASGGNPFLEYTVPLAVIKFRQGFGRLIRRKTDKGSVIVLDSRILTKSYGRRFLNSLPPLRVISGPRASVFDQLRKFHEPTTT
ncbi:MAG: helicase C-terminal domain-containing protein [Candidatus Hydrogenedentota bacterium]